MTIKLPSHSKSPLFNLNTYDKLKEKEAVIKRAFPTASGTTKLTLCHRPIYFNCSLLGKKVNMGR